MFNRQNQTLERLRSHLATVDRFARDAASAPRPFVVDAIEALRVGVEDLEQALREAERSGDRTNRLLTVTEELSAALSCEQVADVILRQGVTALGARAGFVMRPDGQEDLLVCTSFPPSTTSVLERSSLTKYGPFSELGCATGPLLLPGTAAVRYPFIADQLLPDADAAIALLPLTVEEDIVGAIGLRFDAAPRFDPEDRAFAVALAQQGAQALERARLHDAERRARAEAEESRQRLASLADASEALARSLDEERTLDQVVQLAIRLLGDLCIVDLIPENGPRRIAVGYKDPACPDVLRTERRLSPVFWNGPFAVAGVLRTGRPEILAELPHVWTDADAPAPEYQDLFQELGPRSALILPLRIQERTLGAVTVGSYAADRPYRAADLTFAEELARRFAFAIDNARLYREGQEAIRLRDTVLFSVSHDLRSPLAAIRFIGSGLTRDIEGARPIRRNYLLEGLRQIDASAQRIADQIAGLLDAARLQSGQSLRLNREPTDLVALVRQLVAEFQRRSGQHRLRLEAMTPRIVGSWDLGRLERVVGNLLSNAIKYSPGGGDVQVRVSSEEDSEGKSWALLQVQDQGVGIPSADLPRLFSWFFRGQNVAERVPGAGVGLAGAAQIIAQHGGTIDVASEEGIGSTFSVHLPLDPITVTSDASSSDPRRAPLAGESSPNVRPGQRQAS